MKLEDACEAFQIESEDLILDLEDIMDEKDSIDSDAKTKSKKVVNDAKSKAEKLLKDVDGILSKIKEN